MTQAEVRHYSRGGVVEGVAMHSLCNEDPIRVMTRAMASTGISLGCQHDNIEIVYSLDIPVAKLCLDCNEQLETEYTKVSA